MFVINIENLLGIKRLYEVGYWIIKNNNSEFISVRSFNDLREAEKILPLFKWWMLVL